MHPPSSSWCLASVHTPAVGAPTPRVAAHQADFVLGNGGYGRAIAARLGYGGAPNIPSLMRATRFIRVTATGLRESHPHDVVITREAPHYRSTS